jgi:hypothetical protein|tara:strand:+ start:766 stop:1242 length:477 start_codon:yes stop_codon:yes gene_type:complete
MGDNCDIELNKLSVKYKNKIQDYENIYKKYIDKYSKLPTDYNKLVDLKKSTEYIQVGVIFKSLQDAKQTLQNKLKECKKITNKTTIDLLNQSIELNQKMENIKKQHAQIRILRDKKHSSLGQKDTLYDMNIYKKKNIIVLISIIIGLIIILNYLIFNK